MEDRLSRIGDRCRIPLNQMHAVISDIHGNLEALEAVTKSIGDVDIICIGDVVI